MDPEQLALLMAIRGGQGFPTTATPPYAAPAGPGPMAAPAPGPPAPRSQWEAILYGAPPAAPEDPRFSEMSRGGKIGLILSALGDVANVLQRRSPRGARTFAPSNYTGQYMEGQRGRAKEKYGETLRADTIKRQQAKDTLDRMTTLEDRAAERDTRRTDEFIRQWREGEKNLRELQEATHMPGASWSEILLAMAEKERKKESEDRAYREEQQRISARHLTLAEQSAARQSKKDAEDTPDKVATRNETLRQRDAANGARSFINEIAMALERGTVSKNVVDTFGPEWRSLTPWQIRQFFASQNEAAGLDEEHAAAVMQYVESKILRPLGAKQKPSQEP